MRYRFPIRSPVIRFSASVRHFTPLVFASFECLKLLEEFETVIQLDYDQVILGDISALAVGDFSMRACQLNSPVKIMLRGTVSGYSLEALGFLTLAFGDKLANHRDLYHFCYRELRRSYRELFMPEMAIFAFMVERFSVPIEFLPLEVWTPHPRDATEKAVVLHGHSQPKFWNGLHCDQWNENYRQWLAMGGRRYRAGRIYDISWRLRAMLLA